MIKYENEKYDMERALYNSKDIYLKNCIFDGEADGESAIKESKNVKIESCLFNLRYPFWHNTNLEICDSEMTEFCRASLWYSMNIKVTNTKMYGIKALRECKNAIIDGCDIISPEFAWSVDKITIINSKVISEYFMLRSSNITFDNVEFKGKYSFQYVKNGEISNCNFETKDALWHAENIIIKDSIIKGEYLAWYSKNLTFINCKIIGTQPFCYCKNLKLVNCEMIDTDLCFEKSEVDASIITPVISIKNPFIGKIIVPEVNKIIIDDKNAKAKIICTHDSR